MCIRDSHYDNLGQRPQGTLGHWMTYSGLLMIAIGVALARVLFGKGGRTWPALVIPALAVAVALAPASVSQRFVSMFDRKDPTVNDRLTMLHIGERMIRAHPLTGVGPNMV